MLRVVVCIKSIKAEILLKDSTKKYAINPYDVYAMQEAKRLKDKMKSEVICVLMGVVDQRIAAELKKLGADRIIFSSDKKFSGADTLATTYVLSKTINKLGNVDLVLCGDHAIDGETGHVGPSLAQRLDFCFLGNVDSLDYDGTSLKCFCKDDKYNYTYYVEKGTVISVSNCVLKDVTLSIMQLKRINSIHYEVWTADDLEIDKSKCGMEGSRTRVVEVKQMSEKNSRNTVILDIKNKDQIILMKQILRGEDKRIGVEI